MNPKWMKPEEFEQEFGMKKSTQAKKRSAGKLPYSKFGGMVLYDREKINELFEAHHIDVAS
jgi:hypothetical protein